MHKKTFYVTTPIYYVTAKPHLGSLYSTVIADFFARWYRLKGYQTRMVTGTDEHGQKVAQAAENAGERPQDFVDHCIPFFHETWQAYNIHCDRFIRTTDEDHHALVDRIVKKLLASNDLYTDYYEGWYCTPCETFITEKMVDNQAPSCSSCQRETKFLTEKAYFFRLSSYQEALLAWYDNHPSFIVPIERTQEVKSFVAGGLKDLCISRTTVKWGIPFPNDPEHTVYVWVEALCNYLTASGKLLHGSEISGPWWPAQMHVVGKDIVRFHAVYWPALLMAANLPLPHQLLVHGWITVDAQKMSKSLGNVIDPISLLESYDADVIRYYLLRAMPITQDGDFSFKAIDTHYTADLSNDLGNLVQRVIVLAKKKKRELITPPERWGSAALELRDSCYTMLEEVDEYIGERMVHLALARIWAYIHQLNSYFHSQEPWKIKDDQEATWTEVISATLHGIRVVATLLSPVMPKKMETMAALYGDTIVPHEGTDFLERLSIDPWQHSFSIKDPVPLFPKREIELIAEKKAVEATEIKQSHEEKGGGETIGIDAFTAVHLIVGTIIDAQEVANSEKLLKLKVDCGSYGMRQILSGVRQWYTPASLIGVQAIFVANLAPRKMVGILSEGMMVCAKDEQGNFTIATVQKPMQNGTRLS